MPFGLDQLFICTVNYHSVKIIDIDFFDIKSVYGASNHRIQVFELDFFPQADTAVNLGHGQNELQEDLVVQIFRNQPGIILTLL